MKNCDGNNCQKEFINECLCANTCENFGCHDFCLCGENNIYPIINETSCDGLLNEL